MITRRCVLAIGVCVGLGVLACVAPTAPHPDAVRFAELLRAPAWTLGAARDSAFARELVNFRASSGFVSSGVRVARANAHWTALWDTVSRYSNRPPIAVDFSGEMVVLFVHGLMHGIRYNTVEILHVTRQRDTLFVLTRIDENDCSSLEGSASPIDARVVPLATVPAFFVVERRRVNCRTGEYTPIW